MKRFFSIGALLVLFGCASAPGKFLAVTAKTVHTSMVDFYVVANTKGVSPDFSNKVESAYQTYQEAMSVATNNYASYSTTNQGPWFAASNVLWQSQVFLLSLLNQK